MSRRPLPGGPRRAAVMVSVTNEERERFMAAAKTADMTVNSWIRQCCNLASPAPEMEAVVERAIPEWKKRGRI